MKLALGAVAAVCVVGASPSAHAYVLKKTPAGAVVHWNATESTLVVDPSVDKAERRAREAIQKAADAWNASDAAAPRIRIAKGSAAAEPGFDKLNAIFYRASFAPAGTAIAVTVVSYEEASGSILDADIVLTGRYTYSASDEVERDRYDLVHVVGHEQGHWLGLGDENQLPSVLMFSATKSGQTLLRSPSDDDRAGVSAIYEGRTPLPAAVASGCRVADSGGGALGSSLASSLFGLGLVLTSRLRRRRRVWVGVTFLTGFVFASGANARASTTEPGVAERAVFDAVVLGRSATWEGGLLRSEVRVRPAACDEPCAQEMHVQVWGGEKDGIVQNVGEESVPVVGYSVLVVRSRVGLRLAR